MLQRVPRLMRGHHFALARTQDALALQAGRGHLLRDAVKRAEPPDQLRGINSNHAPVLEHELEDLNRFLIITVPVSRHEHLFVRDVKIRVTGGQPLSIVFDQSTGWQLNNTQRLAVLVAQREVRQPRARRPQRALGIVGGRVSGWGRAVAHERGWRSQFAYPYDLYLLRGGRVRYRAAGERLDPS